MNNRGQAKLYYLYMMSDGNVSANEKKLFGTICKELNLDADEKKNIIKECREIVNDKGMNCIEVLEKNAEDSYMYGPLDIDLNKYGTDEEKAKILWNLINLGYSDTHYFIDEREVVDYLREYWEIPESLYQEMIDVAETCLALEKHKQWVDTLPESDYKAEKIKQIKKDIKFTQETIKTTLSEIDF